MTRKLTFKDVFELDLAQMLAANEDGDVIVRWAGEKLLQSYKNGISAGRQGGMVIRKGKSRSHNLPSRRSIPEPLSAQAHTHGQEQL